MPLTKSDIEFIKAFNFIAVDVHDTAIDKGWWEDDRSEAEIIALIHSELSEALEFLRHGNTADDKIPDFLGVEAELADVIIRLMDYAVHKNYRVAEALIAKIKFNRTRPRKHGKKF